MAFDPLTLGMLAILAVLIFFMFRNGRKRQRDAASLQSQMVVGARVMSNSGIYGTILSIDEDTNEVLLESTPGTVLALHRQTIARVITDDVAPSDSDEDEVDVASSLNDDTAISHNEPEFGEPEFGERTNDSDNKKSDD